MDSVDFRLIDGLGNFFRCRFLLLPQGHIVLILVIRHAQQGVGVFHSLFLIQPKNFVKQAIRNASVFQGLDGITVLVDSVDTILQVC